MIYFVQQGDFGPIKIGISINFDWRIETLQNGSPYPLRVLGTMDGDEHEEKLLHAAFSAVRMEGEWFNPDYCLLHFIYHHTDLNNEIRNYKPKSYSSRFPDLTPQQAKIAEGILKAVKDGPKPRSRLHSYESKCNTELLDPVLDYLTNHEVIESVITGEANIEHLNPNLRVWRLLKTTSE